MFLYFKEGQFTMVGSRLQEAQSSHHQRQNATPINRRSHQQKLKKAKYFNKLNLIWGYNNVQIKEGNEWKAAFLTNKELFKPQVMYFRLCNSPETFQRMMNSIFQELPHEEVLVNYMDNFVVPAKTMKELKEQTIRFLKIAEKHNLCFKRSKCDFNMEEISILGVIIGKGQVKIEQKKIKAVKE